METFKNTLAGKKTYIAAILAGAVVAAQAAGLITVEQANTIYALLGAFGLAALRAAVK